MSKCPKIRELEFLRPDFPNSTPTPLLGFRDSKRHVRDTNALTQSPTGVRQGLGNISV